jgi:hypothetical protein
MQLPQGEAITEKQPNSRMGFVCGIDNPIGLRLAFYTDPMQRDILRLTSAKMTGIIMLCLTNTRNTVIGRCA